MTNCLADFWNIDTILPKTLTKIEIKDNGRFVRYCCNCDFEFIYAYCLPVELVTPKEKEFRPYTLKEFFDKFTVGQPIRFRRKGVLGCERYLILNGYIHERYNDQTITYINIGSGGYTLQELFEEYEWQESDTEEFKPFGVEE